MSDYVAKKGTTALGIIGTALGGIATAGGLTGMMTNGYNNCGNYFTKTEASLMYDNNAKDAEIALLKANALTDAKLVEVYTAAAERDKNIRAQINNQINSVRKELKDVAERQMAINGAQAVDNANTASAIAVIGNNQHNMQNIINQLTRTVIPNSSICPGWGHVEVTPVSYYNNGTTIA